MSKLDLLFSIFNKSNRDVALDIIRAPKVDIDLFGSKVAKETYEDYVSPHRLLPVVAKKSFGAALLDLSDEEACSLKLRKYARRRYNRSLKSGHVFRQFEATDHIDDVMEVNQSTDFRQGREIADIYLDKDYVTRMARKETPSFGVFSADDKLLAYTHAPILGDAFVYSRILGHKDYLELGTMFHLVFDTNRWMREHYVAHRYPRWAFYDMFLGAGEGLRYFKQKAGFRPYRVNWQWKGEI